MTIKLGVLALAGPDHGGTYQYTLSMLQALRHTSGFQITLYGNPQNPDFIELGYPICGFSESRFQQLTALTADRMHIRLPDPFVSQDILLAPIYALALLHTSKPFAFTLHDLQENYYPENFSRWQRVWRYQVYSRLLGRARRVICESSYVKTDIIRYFDVPEERIAVIAAPQFRRRRGRLEEGPRFSRGVCLRCGADRWRAVARGRRGVGRPRNQDGRTAIGHP